MSGGKRNTAVNLTTIPMGNGRRGAYIVAGVDLKTGASWWSHHGRRRTPWPLVSSRYGSCGLSRSSE
jgi:hypothetical protein